VRSPHLVSLCGEGLELAAEWDGPWSAAKPEAARAREPSQSRGGRDSGSSGRGSGSHGTAGLVPRGPVP